MHTYNKICPGDISDSPGNHEDLATPLVAAPAALGIAAAVAPF